MIKRDTIVYEKSGQDACLATLSDGKLTEFELFNEQGPTESNVYLGRIVKKVDLAENKFGFMVNIGDTKEAFMSAQERGLLEVNMTEGQCVVVQVVLFVELYFCFQLIILLIADYIWDI